MNEDNVVDLRTPPEELVTKVAKCIHNLLRIGNSMGIHNKQVLEEVKRMLLEEANNAD